MVAFLENFRLNSFAFTKIMNKTVELQGKIVELLVKTLELWQIFALSYGKKSLSFLEMPKKKP